MLSAKIYSFFQNLNTKWLICCFGFRTLCLEKFRLQLKSFYSIIDNTTKDDENNDDHKGDGVKESKEDCDHASDCASEYVPSKSGSKKSVLCLLTVEEGESFKACFYGLIHSSKPIAMERVIPLINKTPKIQHLTNKFTNRQLADKVRTMRKAVARVNERKRLGRKNKA